MVISPNDFSLWARLTGNKYPSTPAERAKKGPEVHNFIQNLDKEGMLGGKEPEQPKKEKNLAEKVATGALIAGGVAAAVAAGRDPRVQNVAKKAASATRTKIDDFLSNIGGPRVIDRDIIDASYDVTPDPRQQQSNTAPTQSTDEVVGYSVAGNLFPDRDNRIMMGKPYDRSDQYQEGAAGPRIPPGFSKPVTTQIERFTPVVEGKTFGTSGAISKLEDIGDAKLRARRTYGPMIDAIQQKNPGINVGGMGRSMLAKAEQDRDYDIAYMVARGQGKTDETATQIARATAGFPTDSPVGKPTPYREFLGEQRTGSIRKESIDNLLKLVEPGPQINLPESVQEPGALVQLAAGSTPSNKVPTMGATIGGSSLTDQHATEMAVDNALDRIRAIDKVQTSRKTYGPLPDVSGPVSVTGIRIAGPSNVQKSGPGVVVDKEGNVVGDANYRSGQRELPIIYSTERETNQQMRRIEPTAEQSIAIRQEQGEVSKDRKGNMMITSPTYDSLTGFKTPSSETVASTPLEERIGRLESKTAELRAIQENLSRAGELMSAGLDPRTTRFDSARAAGLTSKTGIEPRITNPRFQENMNLGKVQEAALPKPSARAYFEQDSEGRIIPATMEERSGDRRVVKGPDTKTIESGGGYQPRGGVGSSIGAYGIEPSDFAQADITKKPTEISLPKTARDKRGMSDLSNQAVIKLAQSGSKGTRQKAAEEMDSRNPFAKVLAGGKAIMGSGPISDPTKADASASFDAAREIRKIQTTGDPATANERVGKFLDDLKKLQGG